MSAAVILARAIVANPEAHSERLRQIAWLILKTATGKPARQITPGGREAGP